MKKLVLVTGGSRGIGAAIVDRLLKDKYEVIYTSTMPKKPSRRRNLHHAVIDFAQFDWTRALVKTLQNDRSVLYGVINNAGICKTAPLGDASFPETWDTVIRTNLSGPADLVSELVRAKLVADGGRIINISSQLGHVGRAEYSAYCASKAGIDAITKVWAAELGERRITVNTVSPGWIETDMTDDDLARLAKAAYESLAIFKRRITSKLDLRRMNSPEEVAGIVRFLLSEEGSGITGRDIRMAGPSA